MHILAYGFDLENLAFRRFLQANEALMQRHDVILVQNLINAGYELDLNEYLDYTWERQRGGWKSLNFLIDKGLCRGVDSFFNELFVGDLRAESPDFSSPAEVVAVIRGAGGIPVWAHPANSLSKKERLSPQDDESIVAQMVDAGIQGLEVYACHHDEFWTARCLAWADQYDLLITGGSDSHGGFVSRHLGQPEIYLGDLRLGPITELVIS
jgi:predicted metal-dependent phosphoesterase TrpH